MLPSLSTDVSEPQPGGGGGGAGLSDGSILEDDGSEL